MKYIKSFLVIALLIGLPAGSWYFLQHGLDWRREKRTQLVPKADILKDNNWSAEDLTSIQSKLARRTTLLVMKDDYSARDLEIVEQFKDAYTFQSLLSKDLSQALVSRLPQHDYLLIDTGTLVRQVYDGSHDSVMVNIVEDIALIAPQRKEMDIKLRTEENE